MEERKKERKKEWKRKKIKIRVKERKEKREIACERKREKQFNAINLVGFHAFQDIYNNVIQHCYSKTEK